MKLAINLILSFGMLALCVWLVWPNHDDRDKIEAALQTLEWAEFVPYLLVYFGLMVVSHLCRSLRWNYLLAPLGIRVPPGPLLAISSVGFMAILALPARLGEFVRPGLLRRRGISASAALGTVAVERIIDGLMISLFVFFAFIARRGPDAPGWMMPTAFIALGAFIAALFFIVFAMKKPEATVAFCIKLSLLNRFAPRIAKIIEAKLLEMIRGFAVLRDIGNMTKFCLWTAVYWAANGFTVWVLAQAFHLPLTLIGGFAIMGIVGVGISLPNSPGLVGQYQALTLAGLALYLGPAVEKDGAMYGLAFGYAMTQHLFQVAWYVGTGALGLATPWVSIHDLRHMNDKPQPAPAPVE
ncbi:MAG: lysylphosphatidylglycerol synthase transmembrane domain-containing protein [Kofleriaceae bacterium]